jgi:hypothetical protein
MSAMTTNPAGYLMHPYDYIQRRRWSGNTRRAPVGRATP